MRSAFGAAKPFPSSALIAAAELDQVGLLGARGAGPEERERERGEERERTDRRPVFQERAQAVAAAS
jgi:hypothetical protein